MSWAFQETAADQLQAVNNLCVSTKRARISFNSGLVLLAIMGNLVEEAGEFTIALRVKELATACGLSPHQIKRCVAELTSGGLIVRRQDQKRPGIEAITTILPAAFAAVGITPPTPELEQIASEPLPKDLAALLCGQPVETYLQVATAWLAGQRLQPEQLSQGRGGQTWRQRVCRVLDRRALQIEVAACEAAQQAEQRRLAEMAGFAHVDTANGPVTVDIAQFEQDNPGAVKWAFIHDVLQEIRFRDPSLITRQSLPRLIAEAAYSRSYAPFCRGLEWRKGVWALGGQMAKPGWGRPHSIWEEWYVIADSCCGAPAHH